MNIGLQFRNRLAKVSPDLLAELDSLVSAIQNGYNDAPEYSSTSGYKVKGRPNYAGTWVEIPWHSGMFSGSGSMLWTVGSDDHLDMRYSLDIGDTMEMSFMLGTTTLSGVANTSISIAIPPGWRVGGTPGKTGLAQFIGNVWIFNNSVWDVGHVRAVQGQSSVQIFKRDASNFTLETNVCNIRGQIRFQVELV